jgi:hypothetical protein
MSPLTESTRLVLKKDSVAATDTNIREVSLLLHGNGTNGSTTITDSSLTPKAVTAAGNAQISTAQSKFGGASIAFDATGDYLTVTDNVNAFAFGTGNFTIELWLRLNAVVGPTGGLCLYDQRPTNTQDNSPTLYIPSSAAGGALSYYTGGANRIVGTTLAANTWYFIALSRASGSTKLFLDGVQIGSTFTDSISYVNTSGRPWIGAFSDSTTPTTQASLNGYIDDLRITKGVARYTSNFTPPTLPFPDF